MRRTARQQRRRIISRTSSSSTVSSSLLFLPLPSLLPSPSPLSPFLSFPFFNFLPPAPKISLGRLVHGAGGIFYSDLLLLFYSVLTAIKISFSAPSSRVR